MLTDLVKVALLGSLACGVQGAEWSLDAATEATTLLGVGVAHDTLAVAATAYNGIGAANQQYDGAYWAKNRLEAGMIMDTAVNPSGISVSVSMWQVLVSTDNGESYTNTSLTGLSQDVNVYGTDNANLAAVGTWATPKDDGTPMMNYNSGVATSSDNGATWTVSAEVTYPRYGAFPSENTWFISGGMWGEDPAQPAANAATTKKLSSRVGMNAKGSMTSLDQYAAPPAAKASADAPTGWFGTVHKTVDGGKSFTKVFETNLNSDYLYFNGIACSSETSCVAVAEGDSADGGYLTVAYTTADGGDSWTQTHSSNSDVSLMGATAVSDTEYWIAGTAKNGRALEGQFYHSLDAGMTWALEQSLDNCFPLDVEFGEKVGFAACMSSTGSSCSVAVYA